MTTTYTVRYRPIGSGDEGWTEVTGVTGTSHALTGLTAGVRYDVEVTAVSAGGSSPAVVAQRSTRCAAPAQPTVVPTGYELSADDGDGTNGALAASWSTVTGAVSHRLRYRVADGPGAWVTAISPSTGTEVFDTTATNIPNLAGTASFDVEVAAVNQDGDLSAWSPTQAAVPARIAAGGTVAAVSAGGTVTHVVHTFATVGDDSFVLHRDRDLDHLLVAGGGGGGGSSGTLSTGGGGGGAGGLITSGGTPVARSAGTYTVTVGQGGTAGPTSGSYQGGDGGASSLAGPGLAVPLAAAGGGGGGSGTSGGTTAGRGGGSGGGAGWNGASTSSGGAGTNGQGSGGGSRSAASPHDQGSGGGGGAGASGDDGRLSPVYGGGAGGAGVESSITGEPVLYAGGGGAGGYSTGTPGAGGSGGGGAGGAISASGVGNAGTSGRGGGGGGGSRISGTGHAGGAGGSGVVILRYALPT